MKKILFVILGSLLLSSCFTSKLHYFGQTPKKPGRYPHFTWRDSLAGYLDKERAGYDVTFYDLDLTLDPRHEKLGGEVTICFRALRKLKTFRFDLYRNLKINSVTFSGRSLVYSRRDRAVFASLPDSLEAGKFYSVKVSYEGAPLEARKPPWLGGMVWKRDKLGNPWVGVTCETEGASIWFPCKDHLSDEPDSVRLHMTVPEGLKIVSNGILEDHNSGPGTESYTWSTHYPINIYDITFYAGRFVHIADTMMTGQGVLNLDYYVMPENSARAKDHFRQVKDVIKIYSQDFGPYPWIKEGYKLVESPYEGMENQTAIAYGNGYKNISWMGADYIIVHESAHEWWGNAVSVSDFSDIWLQEGFATYSELLYIENKKGYDTSLMYANYWLAGTIKNRFPVVGPRDVNYWDYRDGDAYGKGAMILHTIRNVIDDSTLFFDILQTFYREHAAGSHVTTSDFRDLLERKTGQNWEKFFEVYLYGREIPVLKWYYVSFELQKGDGTSGSRAVPVVAARWINVPEGFSMPVKLTCSNPRLSETINVTTRATLFYLRKINSCKELGCNAQRSYFTTESEPEVLSEAEHDRNQYRNSGIIAGPF